MTLFISTFVALERKSGEGRILSFVFNTRANSEESAALKVEAHAAVERPEFRDKFSLALLIVDNVQMRHWRFPEPKLIDSDAVRERGSRKADALAEKAVAASERFEEAFAELNRMASELAA